MRGGCLTSGIITQLYNTNGCMCYPCVNQKYARKKKTVLPGGGAGGGLRGSEKLMEQGLIEDVSRVGELLSST